THIPFTIPKMSRKGETLGFKRLLAMAMFAHSCFCILQKGSAVVTAFSIATTLSNRSTAAASKSISKYGVRPAFHRTSSSSATAASASMQLRMSTAVVEKPVDLQKKSDVEHPAFEILNKDFVEEYGAAATLYRHKKSGAELLSVSTDDDNKVFGITFRTPRK
ncbi:MAG: hypothetical protein ACI8RD_008628, partial [Bacillariaceae sp.]